MSDAALIASALLMGLAGGPHCAAMCGAACGGIVRRCGGAAPRRATLALHLGRVASYAFAGALIAASVGSIGRWADAAPVLRPLWAMVHVAAIALGGWLVWHGTAPAWLGSLQPLRGVSASGGVGRAALIGAGWAVLPCGLLQSALIVASFASGPAQGAGVMAAFALASGLSLGLAPWLWQRLRTSRWQGAGAVRLAGLILVGSSTYGLVHGLSLAIAGLCATPG
jgi:sulfite exporter TauE/SafE